MSTDSENTSHKSNDRCIVHSLCDVRVPKHRHTDSVSAVVVVVAVWRAAGVGENRYGGQFILDTILSMDLTTSSSSQLVSV